LWVGVADSGRDGIWLLEAKCQVQQSFAGQWAVAGVRTVGIGGYAGRHDGQVGDAAFWVSPGGADGPRFSPGAIGGATGRTLLVADDPDAMFAQAVAAGATVTSEMADEHGWRLGRIFDPFGHEWEVGRPLGPWPPA
jgi:Glyoxalase-like domain